MTNAGRSDSNVLREDPLLAEVVRRLVATFQA